MKIRAYLFRQHNGGATICSCPPMVADFGGRRDMIPYVDEDRHGDIFYRRDFLCKQMADRIGVPDEPLRGVRVRITVDVVTGAAPMDVGEPACTLHADREVEL